MKFPIRESFQLRNRRRGNLTKSWCGVEKGTGISGKEGCKEEGLSGFSANWMNDPSVQVSRDDVQLICDLEQ